MISGEATHSRCVMGRLERGERVIEKLVELARFEKIDAGFVHAHGIVEEIELVRWDVRTRRNEPLASVGGIDGPWELVSLAGNVSLHGGVPEVALWAVIASAVGGAPRVLAGRLAAARAVHVEFAVDVYDDADLERRDDPVTGLAPWRPPRRR